MTLGGRPLHLNASNGTVRYESEEATVECNDDPRKGRASEPVGVEEERQELTAELRVQFIDFGRLHEAVAAIGPQSADAALRVQPAILADAIACPPN